MQDKADMYKGLNLRLTYEHVTGISRAEWWIRRTTIGCVGMLALIAGTASYLHMHLLVELHGQPGWGAEHVELGLRRRVNALAYQVRGSTAVQND